MTGTEDVEQVIEDPMKFKKKLGIGEGAFRDLVTRQNVEIGVRVLGTAGAGWVGGNIAGSSAIATTFFAPTGLLASLGIGGVAVTPIGWVIASGFALSAGYYVISKYSRGGREDRVDVIPKWLNTPLDVLATDVFGLFATLGLRAAAVVDGGEEERERAYIENYFVNEWGYSKKFIQAKLPIIESNHESFYAPDLVNNLIEFLKGNPDCNYETMSKELVAFLKEVARADERFDESEVIFIQWLENMLKAGEPSRWEKFAWPAGGNGTRPTTPIGDSEPEANSEAADAIASEKNEPGSDTGSEGLSKLTGQAVKLALFWR